MKIGVDIDGVLTDLATFHLDYGIKYAYENNLGEIKDPYGYKISDVINISKDSRNFWDKYSASYKKKKYTREFASEILHKLKDEENEIHIITARNPKTEFKEEWTTSWLDENDIHYDKLIFTDKKKEYCIENKIDLMIEDSVDTILELSKYISVICYDTPYNHDCDGKNIIRAYSWYDIYRKIKSLEDGNGARN